MICKFVHYKLTFSCLQVSQRDIINSIEREMSGDLREGFKTCGEGRGRGRGREGGRKEGGEGREGGKESCEIMKCDN